MTSRLRTLPALAFSLVTAVVLSGCGPSNLVRGVRSPLSFGFCGLIVIVLDILAILDLWKSSRSDSDKLLWTLFIVVFPFVGLIAYYRFGKR